MSFWQIAVIVAAALVAMAVLGLLARWAARVASPPPVTSVQRIPTATVPKAELVDVPNVPECTLGTSRHTEPSPAEMPPEAARYAPRRHRDPGADFASQPKPRSDLAIRGVPATQVNVTAPADRPSEMRWQLENRDWTEWRSGSAAPPKLIRIIGYEWRLRG